MGVFLILVLIIIVMVFIGREKGRRDAEETIAEIQKVVQSKDNMGYEELIAMHDATEKEWKEWDSKYNLTIAKGQDPSLVKQKRTLAAYKIKQAREEIKKRYPAVITDSEGLKKKAHLLATLSEEKEMKALEDKLKSLNAQYRALGPPSIPLHGKTHSSILRGVAAQALGGPVAGAITYAATEAQNKAVVSTNSSIRAEYSLREELGEKIDDTQKKLEELSTKVIRTHDKSVQIHLYSVKNVY